MTEAVSGFTGGKLKNPTYRGNHRGHFEAVEVESGLKQALRRFEQDTALQEELGWVEVKEDVLSETSAPFQGLPAFVLVKVLSPGFFAREDTVTPFKMAAATVAANVALSLILFWPLGHVGIALATALAAWLNAVLLAVALRRRGFLTLDARLKGRLPRVALASLIMGLALWAGARWLGPWFEATIWLRVASLAILVGGGLALYAGLAYGLRAVDRAELAALLKRRRKRTPGADEAEPPP
ncbi:MAG: polysaccharide biosynthesis C-terminal domain-containing protein [Proteobacteria bacterium]|nr:polysaccharide biosynthesis C-terminal domain-containing protein [Pseudomonadota bacterium]